MGLPLTVVDELCKVHESLVHRMRSTMFDTYRASVAELNDLHSAGAASGDGLHKAVLARYLKGVARIKEHALNAARRIADDRVKETPAFKEVRYNYSPLLHETDVL
jgi:hypothetical protein